MRYSEIVNINETFQYSVNIGFDLGNMDKLIHYIPTRDSIEILNKYIDALTDKKERANLLIGAYGKGKSHLMLVLLTLINDYEHTEIIDDLLEKISSIDNELVNKINKFRNKKKKIIPVIINPNLGDLKQSFLVGLKDALERENIQGINTKTDYDYALEVIERWKNEYEEALEKYKKCLEKYDITSNELITKLKNCDKEGLEKFKEVYSCVNYGAQFNSLLANDVESYYKNIGEEIKKLGYTGMFIVFDEFSKFLDNTDETNMGNDMAILQSMAELATRSENDLQIHLTCITHKSIGEYSKNLSQNIKNSFRTVEGRFKEIHFVKNISQTYDMVSKTIRRNENFKIAFDGIYEKNKGFYNDVIEYGILAKADEKTVIEECFPLNPFTVESLVMLSEKIAQNERTLFTFISDNSEYSLKNFIKKEENFGKLLNVNMLYDYFENSFVKENNEILSTYLKGKHSIDELTDENEINIIKTLTIYKIIEDTKEAIIEDNKIRLSNNLSLEEYDKAINNLINNNILKRNKRNNSLDFSSVCSKELFEEINTLVNNKFKTIDISETLSEMYNLDYTIPRKYNDIYRMTRYFLNEFILDTDIYNNKNTTLNNLLSSKKSDGKVLFILKSDIDKDIEKELDKYNYDDVIYTTINLKPSVIETLKEYNAIREIENNSANYDEIFLKEIAINKEEIKEFINQYIKENIDSVKEYKTLNKEKIKNKSRSHLASEICLKKYSNTPIINNELINKENLTAQVNKGRINIINSYLDYENIEGTSLEGTLYKSTFNIIDKNDEILNIIRNELVKIENTKVTFKNIFEILTSAPYSMRKGIIPIYFAIVIREYLEEAILYFEKKEIEINGENLVKIVEKPQSYYLKIEKGTTEKNNYINNIIELFGQKVSLDNRKNKRIALDSMKNYILELPRISREVKFDKIEDKNINKEIIDFRNKISLYDINRNEFLFEIVPKIFKNNDLNDCYLKIKEMKEFLDTYHIKFKEKIIKDTYNIINKNYKGELFGLLKSWYENINTEVLKTILPVKTNKLIEFITNNTSASNETVINKLSNILTSLYIEDYMETTYDEYIDNLKEIIKSVNKEVNTEETKKQNTKIRLELDNNIVEKIINQEEISFLGETLKNNLESSLDEFGESIDQTEKINILLDLLKKYL